jgi:hypothetical protein
MSAQQTVDGLQTALEILRRSSYVPATDFCAEPWR